MTNLNASACEKKKNSENNVTMTNLNASACEKKKIHVIVQIGCIHASLAYVYFPL
jgi:hypothetical protein